MLFCIKVWKITTLWSNSGYKTYYSAYILQLIHRPQECNPYRSRISDSLSHRYCMCIQITQQTKYKNILSGWANSWPLASLVYTYLLWDYHKYTAAQEAYTKPQTDPDRKMSTHILAERYAAVPLRHQFFWHLETNSAFWQQHQGMPVAIPTIIPAVATIAPVGNFPIPCK